MPGISKRNIRAGQPTLLTPEVIKIIEMLSPKGLTDKELAQALSVDEATLNNWKKQKPKFFESLKSWKNSADRRIEASLYQRACGYSAPETKVQWVQDESGGRWETVEYTKHYAPDPTSMIFWLKNRQPDVWRDKVQVDSDVAITIQVIKHTDIDQGQIVNISTSPKKLITNNSND